MRGADRRRADEGYPRLSAARLVVGTTLALGAVFLAAESAGFWTLPLNHGGARILFVVGLLLLSRGFRRPRRTTDWLTLAGAALVFALVVGSDDVVPSRQVAGLVASGGILMVVRQFPGTLRLAQCVVFLATCACLWSLLEAQPLFLWVEDLVTTGVSRTLSVLHARPVVLSPAYLPLLPGLLAAALVMSPGATPLQRRISGLAGVAFTYVAYVNVFAALPEFDVQWPSQGFEPVDLAVGEGARAALLGGTPGLLAMSLALVAGLQAWRVRGAWEEPATPRRRGPTWLACAGVATCFSVVVFLERPALHRTAATRVTFFTPGFVNWLKPDFESYGAYAVGMLGMLPDFAARLGCATRLVDEITPEILEGTDVLVVANHDKPLHEEAYRQVESFVRGGGGLLVLADHTFRCEEGELPTHRLISWSHVRLRFDCANFFVGGWLHSYRFLDSPLSAAIGREFNQHGVVIGASLDVAPPAWSAVAGKYGFSDDGDLGNAARGYLGDMAYRHGERLGDLTLVACEEVGHGRLIVIGDTTPLANSLLPHTHEFANRCFSWLAGSAGGSPPGPFRFASGALILLVGAWAAWRYCPAGMRRGMPLLLVVGPGLVHDYTPRGETMPYTGDVAYIDTAHLPRMALEMGNGMGASGLARNLIRNGYFPMLHGSEDLSHLVPKGVMVVLGPQAPLTRAYVERVWEYASTGGLVLVAGGRRERRALALLLARMGIEITDIPLGPMSLRVYEDVRGVTFRDPYSMRIVQPATKALLGTSGHVLACGRRVGAGQIVFVSDPEFFLNKNLEGNGSFLIGNVVWLMKLLSAHKGGA